MAYADRDNTAMQVTSALFVGLVTAVFLTGLVVALNFSAIKKKFVDTVTIDPTKEPPKPPPPKKLPEPPKVAIKQVTVVRPIVAPHMDTPPPQTVAPPPQVHVETHTEAPAPPPVVRPVARVNLGMDAEDYPASAQRNGEQGTSHMSFTVGADGRVTNCSAHGATPTLDAQACAVAQRRWRFKPATQNGEPVSTSMSQNVRWVLPAEE